MESMRPMICSQHAYRLVAFRADKKRTKFITDSLETFLTSLLLISMGLQAVYIGQKVYFSTPDNFIQTSQGEFNFEVFRKISRRKFCW